jgi:DUF1365 family protein
VKSAIYQGRVRHRRLSPRKHSFEYPLFMLYLDLAALPELFDGNPAWSARGAALAQFRRSDFLGDPQKPLAEEVRRRIFEETQDHHRGPIFLLANLRYFGFITNPIACYYCFAEDGVTLKYIVAEVNNTPWNERHGYVIPAGDGERVHHSFDKRLHVSPFHPMDMQYHWRSNTPGKKLNLHLSNSQAGTTVFSATLCLNHQPLNHANLTAVLWRYPFMTARVCLAIYWQALRLWLKGTPVHNHPKYQTTSTVHE